MKVNFEVLSHKLVLKRYPQKAQKQNLQAWDAADEYLVEHLEQTEELFEGVRLLIINDQFGALACCLYQYSPHWHSDSMVATLGMKENMADNGLEILDHQVSAQTQNIPAEFDLVLIKLPKSHSYLAHLLATIKPMLSAKGKVIAAGKVPQVQKNVLTLFEKYIGSTKTSLAKKKSRLIFSTPNDNKTLCAPPALNWKLEPHEYIITNNANVFSRQKLDIGARFMLDHLPNCKNKQVIDLGCGNGVLGLLALAEQQAETVAFVDDSALAIDSAKATIEQNLPEQLHQCHFIQSNCLEQCSSLKAQVILCNPPFHQQQILSDHIAWQMFTDAFKALHTYGELRVVANRHLGYHEKLKRLFGGAKVIASNAKFVILSAIKHPK